MLNQKSKSIVSLLGASCLAINSITAHAGTWTFTGSMLVARHWHTATLLLNGKVLIAGGFSGGQALSTTELYDATTGTWNYAGFMSTVRHRHTATLLSNGKVLVTGGRVTEAPAWTMTATADLYDPVKNIWTPIGSMQVSRSYHTATQLSNGKVLVTGGVTNGFAPIASAELYDPITDIWTAISSMNTKRAGHSSTLLSNDKVFIAGGQHNNSGWTYLNTTELYDPANNAWSNAIPMYSAHSFSTNALLLDSKILVAGGQIVGQTNSDSRNTSATELYDSVAGTWTNVAAMSAARSMHTYTIFSNGNVLVAGGENENYTSALATTELYNPNTATWSNTGAMTVAREGHTATLLPNDKVLVAGGNIAGYYSPVITNTAELYTSAPTITAPIATTNAATNIAATSAKLNGSVSSDGNTATASFDFGTTTDYGQTIAAVPSQIYSKTAVTISATASSLTCNSPYHFRATAVSSAGTGTGADQTFTTLPCAANSWLTPPTSIVTRDQPFTLEIIVKSDGMKVSSYEFAVTLDPTKLQFDTTYQNAAATCYLGVCPGSNALINRNMVDTNIAAGTIVLTGQDATGQGPGNDLQLVVIHFKTKTAVGAMPVTLVANKLQNPSGGNIGLTTKSATVNVSYGLCGDSDGNRMVNIIDALAIARKLVSLPPPPTIDDLLADTNKNSRVDINDALFIARYAIGLVLPPESCNIGQPL